MNAEPDDDPLGNRPDLGFLVISGLIAVVAAWLLALPASRFVQQMALNRYHLQSRSFVAWAVQAPVPAMYNFRNRFTVQSQIWDDPPLARPARGTLNHFPVRLWTFADGRATLYEERARVELVVTSTYRGRSLTTRWHLADRPNAPAVLVGEVVP